MKALACFALMSALACAACSSLGPADYADIAASSAADQATIERCKSEGRACKADGGTGCLKVYDACMRDGGLK